MKLLGLRLTAFCVACSVMLIAGVALAQSDPPAAVNVNPAALVSWCSFGYILLSSVVAALRPDNPSLPFTVPMSARVMIAAVGGLVLAALTAIVSGVPWMQAVGGMLVAVMGVVMKHAPTPTPS